MNFALPDRFLLNLFVFNQSTKVCRFFQNLEKEMNEIKLAVDNLTSVMIELNNVCDERFVHELEVDTSELTQRFHRVSMQVKEKKLDVERVASVCQDFDKDCDELFAWLKYQWETLDAEDEAPQLLANELTKLKEFEVGRGLDHDAYFAIIIKMLQS